MSNEFDQFAFGKRLEDFRNVEGITRRFLAEKTHCTGATIGRWERGEVPFSIAILADLRNNFGVDLNEFICPDKETE